MNTPSAVWALAAGQGRDWIEGLIPHQGSMCLLDEVLAAHPSGLQARTRSHLRRPHPLALHGERLGAAVGVEYASQAMALHGALIAMAAGQGMTAGVQGQGGDCSGGRLVSLRKLRFSGPLLASLQRQSQEPSSDTPMDVVVRLEAGNAQQASYSFELGCGLAKGALGQVWASGRASVLFVA